MNQDKHDIGKILGCIVFALGSRELLRVVHRLIVGSAMFLYPIIHFPDYVWQPVCHGHDVAVNESRQV
jgi:hypothetical protein